MGKSPTGLKDETLYKNIVSYSILLLSDVGHASRRDRFSDFNRDVWTN